MASSRFQFSFFLFLLLPIFTTLPTEGATGDHAKVEKIVKAVSNAGYSAMSLTLEMTLTTLVSSALNNKNTTIVTIFAPQDKSFFSLKYPQPPLTLLEYHVAPMKLEREDFESSLPLGSKIDTLLHVHPLVVSTLRREGIVSINNVKIKQWDIYKDEHIIIHGVEDFFDPAYQTILHPWYDAEYKENKRSSSLGPSEASKGEKYILALVISLLILVVAIITSGLNNYWRRTGYMLLK
ncbi:hypothetical protein IFM89_024832 [Coptis chinensis]|uniref:FAS1 domain-containing protein n=1 Tax=Coptis chinensis TaxID=261450 RepID=A0A835LNZ9_9MAGN|nr:hypothetical protein IFM89_024832 [Coptis chinensis]